MDNCFSGTHITDLLKEFDETVLSAHIANILDEYNQVSGRQEMSVFQMDYFAEKYIEIYYGESIEDLVYCLNQSLRGAYKDQFRGNAMDPPIIFKWLTEHLEEKTIAREGRIKADQNNRMKEAEDVIEYIRKEKYSNIRADFLQQWANFKTWFENRYECDPMYFSRVCDMNKYIEKQIKLYEKKNGKLILKPDNRAQIPQNSNREMERIWGKKETQRMNNKYPS